MHAPEGPGVAGGNLLSEVRLVGKEFGAVIAVDGEGDGGGGFRDEMIVDAPGLEEACCVRGELETGL